MNGIWIRALPGPMHLGLKTGPLCHLFCIKLEEFSTHLHTNNITHT